MCLLLFAGVAYTGESWSTFSRACAGSISGSRTLFFVEAWCTGFRPLGGGIQVLPDVDGLVAEAGEPTGAVPLGPSAGTIEVEGTSSSPSPAAKDGVDNGQTYSIYQPGERVPDDVASNSWDRGIGRTVKLPEEFIGHVMVFRTFDRVSYGLVMDGLRPVHLGDHLRMPE